MPTTRKTIAPVSGTQPVTREHEAEAAKRYFDWLDAGKPRPAPIENNVAPTPKPEADELWITITGADPQQIDLCRDLVETIERRGYTRVGPAELGHDLVKFVVKKRRHRSEPVV